VGELARHRLEFDLDDVLPCMREGMGLSTVRPIKRPVLRVFVRLTFAPHLEGPPSRPGRAGQFLDNARFDIQRRTDDA